MSGLAIKTAAGKHGIGNGESTAPLREEAAAAATRSITSRAPSSTVSASESSPLSKPLSSFSPYASSSCASAVASDFTQTTLFSL
ncbi:hypothetical protein ACLOJK_010890 [Asimina triloba]